MTPDGQTHLVLWDIDHTLIESPGMGHLVYGRVFPEVTGHSLRELATLHGRTERDIMHDTLTLHGVDPTEQTMRRLATALAEGYRAAIDEFLGRTRVLPGVPRALELLTGMPGVRQSVLTGNTAEVARIKIEAVGLEANLDLPSGAYGDDHRERAELVTIARERLAERHGITVAPDRVVLIGDTPNDVRAAHNAGAHVVAVATGSFSVHDLRSAGAVTVLPDLSDSELFRWELTRIFTEESRMPDTHVSSQDTPQ